MIRYLSIMLLLIVFHPHPGSAQPRYATYLGVGLGRHFEEQFPYTDQMNNGRLALMITQYRHLSNRLSIGLSAMASGRISAIVGGAPAPSGYYDPLTNTQYVNFNNLNAATYLFRTKYEWLVDRELAFYTDLGLGLSTYSYTPVSETSFSISPEIGLCINSLQLGVNYIWGGVTPSFYAPSTIPYSTVLQSTQSNRLYVTLSYRILTF